MLDGKLLDGRNRLKACDELGLVPSFMDVETTEPVKWVRSANVARRHLSASERAIMAAKVATRTWADQHGPATSRINAEGLPPTQSEAAETFNISERSIQQATKLLKSGDEKLIADVESGEKSLVTAEKELKTKFSCPGSISTGYAEWYTPSDYIDRARALMGGIDLDPTSSEKANEAVKATTIHTTEETIPHQNDPRHKEVRERNLNATLAKPWNASTVWMNPPYNAIECAALEPRLLPSTPMALANHATRHLHLHGGVRRGEASTNRLRSNATVSLESSREW